MGLHRSDPLGVARLVLIGVVVTGLIILVVVGSGALFFSASNTAEIEDAAAPASALASAPASPLASERADASRTPTLRIDCAAERCPVFVRVPGGDVLVDEELIDGETLTYFNDRLDVVLDDAGTVDVRVNGAERPAGSAGRRASFTVERAVS